MQILIGIEVGELLRKLFVNFLMTFSPLLSMFVCEFMARVGDNFDDNSGDNFGDNSLTYFFEYKPRHKKIGREIFGLDVEG